MGRDMMVYRTRNGLDGVPRWSSDLGKPQQVMASGCENLMIPHPNSSHQKKIILPFLYLLPLLQFNSTIKHPPNPHFTTIP